MDYMAVRRQVLLDGIDLRSNHGLEIGPLDRPVVQRQDARVRYLDHLDTPGLRAKYSHDPNVPDVQSIVEVDFVLDGRRLSEIVGPDSFFDYVIAAHVIEHVPNLLGWLEQVDEILAPGGTVRLVIPDRRFTFDYLRRETELVDLLTASFLDSKRPAPSQIIDQVVNGREISTDAAWAGCVEPAELDPKQLEVARQLAVECARDGTYHDVHCWVFTPYSFARLMSQCVALGLADFGCRDFMHTPEGLLEFYVVAERMDDPAVAGESWERMAQEAVAKTAGLPEQVHSSDARFLRAELGDLRRALIGDEREDLQVVQRELAAREGELAVLRGSGSYRLARQMGRPVRAVRDWRLRRA